MNLDEVTRRLPCLEAAISLEGTLSKEEQKPRATFLLFAVAALVFNTGHIAATWEEHTFAMVYMVATGIIQVVFFVVALNILCKRPLSTRFTVSSLYLASLGLYMWDLNGRVSQLPSWPMLVLIIDMLLVMRVPARYSWYLVATTVVYLTVMLCEQTWRFGFFDLPGLKPQEGTYGRREFYSKVVACDKIPCASPTAASSFTNATAVFLIDFFVTRGFAREVLKEQAAMEKTIEAVQEIASLLAKYDVEGVARMLKMREAELPEQMYETLHSLEQNLRMYRPYLPAALFEEMEEEDDVDETLSKRMSVAPPGLTTETATIVFTDILSSTSIWEHAPEGMRAGLKIHNSVMRKAMSLFGGYEVKTIGDAFMVAFSTTQDGVNFGLHVHELLRDASWPASLLEDAPICAEQGSLWGGLTVRIGVNTGPVSLEQNTLTGRTDYFGHTVNVASRLESTCKPGAVAVPSDLYTSDCMACSAVVGDAEALDLKGVSGTTFVCCVWPLSLAGRMQRLLIHQQEMQHVDTSPVSSHAGSYVSGTSLLNGNMTVDTCCDATTAVVELITGTEGNPSALRYMSASLSTLTVALDQSRGTLVTLLGNRVCVGWNLTRPSPAHMENAIHFAQRLQIVEALAGAGLVSGPIQHGDVGARKQRFVTVMGRSVHRSWALCDQAVRGGGLCLFEPPVDTVLPSSMMEDMVGVGKDQPQTYKIFPVHCTD